MLALSLATRAPAERHLRYRSVGGAWNDFNRPGRPRATAKGVTVGPGVITGEPKIRTACMLEIKTTDQRQGRLLEPTLLHQQLPAHRSEFNEFLLRCEPDPGRDPPDGTSRTTRRGTPSSATTASWRLLPPVAAARTSLHAAPASSGHRTTTSRRTPGAPRLAADTAPSRAGAAPSAHEFTVWDRRRILDSTLPTPTYRWRSADEHGLPYDTTK